MQSQDESGWIRDSSRNVPGWTECHGSKWLSRNDMKQPEIPMTLLWLQNIANASDLAVLVHFSSCIRKGKGQWGFSYVPVEFPIESIALRIAPWSPRMSCLNFVKVCFHPSRIMILPAKTQRKSLRSQHKQCFPWRCFAKYLHTLQPLQQLHLTETAGMGRWRQIWQMMAGTWQGQSSAARHLAQTLGARADGAGLVAEALDSDRFRRSGHAKTT